MLRGLPGCCGLYRRQLVERFRQGGGIDDPASWSGVLPARLPRVNG